jgi:hypothetical protein
MAYAAVSHYNCARSSTIYATPQGRDLGVVTADIRKVMQDTAHDVPNGSSVELRGKVTTMTSAYQQLLVDLAFAIMADEGNKVFRGQCPVRHLSAGIHRLTFFTRSPCGKNGPPACWRPKSREETPNAGIRFIGPGHDRCLHDMDAVSSFLRESAGPRH